MRLNELSDNPGASRPRKRKGRGPGSGSGKTAGRGIKGQKSRSGVSINGYEGGQMPLYQRLPKRGFNRKKPFKVGVLNLARIQTAIDAKSLDPKKTITEGILKTAGLVKRNVDCVKVLAKGQIFSPVSLVVWDASEAACEAVRVAGGELRTTVSEPYKSRSGQVAQDIVDQELHDTTLKQAEAGMRLETAMFTRSGESDRLEVCVDVTIAFAQRVGATTEHKSDGLDDPLLRTVVAVFSDEVRFEQNQSLFSDFEEVDDKHVVRKRFQGEVVDKLPNASIDVVVVQDNQVVRRFSNKLGLLR